MQPIKTATSILVLSAFLAAAPAYAADPTDKGSTLGIDVLSAPAMVNFSGFYVGGSVGYGNSNHNLTVHDYFKDFCADKDDANSPEFNPFDDETGHGRHSDPIRERTLSAKRIWKEEHKGIKAGDLGYLESCEKSFVPAQAAIPGVPAGPDGNPPAIPAVPAVPATTADTNYVTVPGDSREIGSLDGVNAHGVVGDVRLGYDHAMGRFLVGIWGSYGFNAMEAESVNTIAGFLPSGKLEKQDEFMIGARAGLIVAPRTLAYILAGYANTSYEFSGVETISAPGGKAFSKETDFSGIVVGGGVEFALAQNVFFGVEYQHTFYGEETIFDAYNKTTNVGGRIDDDLDEDKVLATLKIKFNSFRD